MTDDTVSEGAAKRPAEIPFQIITPSDVRASVERARLSLEKAAKEIVWQIEMESWVTLGYRSWTEMREAEYGGAAFMVPRADRPELVARMRRSGLTQQEIADTAGVNAATVSRDLANAGSAEPTPNITNTRGQERPASYAPRQAGPEPLSEDEAAFFDSTEERDDAYAMGDLERDEFEVVLAEARAEGDLSRGNVAAKSREASNSSRRRHPLPDSYWRSMHDLHRKAESITRLVADDRYAANRPQVTARNQSEVLRTLGMVSAAAASLDPATLAQSDEVRDWWLTNLTEITAALDSLGHTIKEYRK